MDQELYSKIVDALFDGVYCVDTNRVITFWSKSAERITGYKMEEVIGKCCADNILRHIDADGNELCLMGCPLMATLQDSIVRDAHVYLHHKKGHRVAVTVRATPIFDKESKEIVGAIEIFQDTSRRDDIIKELEQLRQEVLLDELTNVGNRRFADIKLQAHMIEYHDSSLPFGTIFLDIDHFKKFNDTYGHNIGDQVLIMVSKTISNLLRPLDTVVRWGGEEFVVMLPNIDGTILKQVAERIRFFIEKCWLTIDDKVVTVTVSVGGVLARAGDSPSTIIDRADSLMYISKNTGRNRVTTEE